MTMAGSCRDQLGAIAAQMRTAIAETMTPDHLAYAALDQDGELHPWTEEAEQHWTGASDPDPWRAHHLAVLHHARAYDLEQTGSPEAFRYWIAALRYWSQVHADDTFWVRMERQLGEHLGAELAPDLVPGVRARLPRELLEPHRNLVATYQLSDPERAKGHLGVLKAAPFDPDLIDGVRLLLVEEVLATVTDGVDTGDFDTVRAELRRWLHLDEGNAHLVRSLLYTYRKLNERVWNAGDGVDLVAKNVAAAEQIVKVIGEPPADPAGVARYTGRLAKLRPGGLPAGALVAEVARHEIWSGLVSKSLAHKRLSLESLAESGRECERHVSRAVTRFSRARLLDPQLALDNYYSALPSIEADAESLWGLCLLTSGKKDYVGAAQHFRRACTLDPTEVESFLGLAQALIASGDSAAVLTEAEQALARADGLAEKSGDKKARASVTQVRGLLGARRLRTLGERNLRAF